MSSGTSTRILEAGEHAAWNQFVAASADGSPYANTAYLERAVRGGRRDVPGPGRRDGGELAGGIALYERPSRWGVYLEPRLLLQYNGFVLRPARSQYPSEVTAHNVKVLQALGGAVARRSYATCVVKSRATLADGRVFGQFGWKVWPTYTYVVPLDDLAAQWGLVEQNLRRLVKRAEKEGLTVTEDDDFASFYRLHLDTHRRKGAPLYLPEASFRAYVERLRALGLWAGCSTPACRTAGPSPRSWCWRALTRCRTPSPRRRTPRCRSSARIPSCAGGPSWPSPPPAARRTTSRTRRSTR